MRRFSLFLRSVTKSLILVLALSSSAGVFAQDAASADTAKQSKEAKPAAGAAEAATGDAAAGEALFKQKCTACHAIDRVVIGPALKGIPDTRDRAWLHKWIRNSQALVASGDAEAVKIFNEFNKTVMTPFPELSDGDIDNILAYVKQAGEKPAANAAAGAAGASAGSGDGVVSNFMLIGLILVVVIALAVIVVLNRVIKTLEKLLLQKQGLLVENEEDEALKAETESLSAKIQRFSKNKKRVGLVAVILVLLLGSWAWMEMWNTGVHTGYQPTQPIKFPHDMHAGTMKIDCQYCHGGAYKSKNASIPSLNVCMNCHNYVQATDKYNGEISPEIMKIYKALDYDPQTKKYGDNPKPVQWVRIHNLPDFAYFNHSQHVTVAGLKCQECHGPIETMSEVYQYSPLTMKWCINCHRTKDVNFKGNAYYDKIVEIHDLIKKGEKVTPAVLGGIECGKCHY